jgi:hypothetical protein
MTLLSTITERFKPGTQYDESLMSRLLSSFSELASNFGTTYIFNSSKPDADTKYAFEFNALNETTNVLKIARYKTSAVSLQDIVQLKTDLSGVRLVFTTTNVVTSGQRFETLAGPITFAPLAAAGGILNPVAAGNALQLSSVYTVVQLATYSATTYAGALIRCSDGNSGTACLALAQGGSWLRIAPGIAVSAT